jgi:hypothetical protein
VERLEAGAKKVSGMIEEECHELLCQAATRIFSNLLHADSSFELDTMMASVPAELRDGLGKAMEGYVDTLLKKFIHTSESSGEVKGSEGDGDEGDDGSASS